MPIGPPVEALDPMMLPHDTLPPPPKMSLPMPEVDLGLGEDLNGSSGCVAIHQPVFNQMPRNSIADNVSQLLDFFYYLDVLFSI